MKSHCRLDVGSQTAFWLVAIAVALLMITVPASRAQYVQPAAAEGGSLLGPPPAPPVQELKSVRITDDMLPGLFPDIPNLEVGYFHAWGGGEPLSRLTIDYMVPVPVRGRDIAFLETHGRFENIFETFSDSKDSDFELLLGGGYRHRINRSLMFGVHGFYYSMRQFGKWSQSSIFGWKVASVIAGDGKLIVDSNVFFDLFGRETGFFEAVQGLADWNVKATYSQPFLALNRPMNVKVNVNRYWLTRAARIERGWSGGVELETKNRAFSATYDIGHDVFNETWQSVGLYARIGFQPGKLLARKNPFSLP